MITRRRFASLSTTLAASSLLPARFAGAASPSPGPRRGGTLIVNLEPEPSSFLFNAQTAGVLAAQVVEGLIEYDEHFKPRPALAERWEVSPDGRTATFHLRPGVMWHDGKPFTAADVGYTVDEVIKKVNPRAAAAFKLVEAVETPDPLTVTFRLSEPSPALWSILSSAEAGILPRHLYEGTPPLENPWNRKLVGTGPFIFKEWVRGDFVLLERNRRYWRENRPYLDRIRFKTITDPGAREAALEAGEVHYTPFSVVPPSDVERLRSVPGLRVETRGYGTFVPVFFLDFNLDRPRLRDKRIRAAFAHAIDRQALADRVWYGLARPATGPIPSTQVEFYTADTTQYAFDPKRAESLLDEAGLPRGPDGVRLRLDHYAMPYGDVLRRAAEFIKEQLRQVGVELTLVNLDLAPFLRKIYGDRDFDTYSTYYSASADPQIGVVRRYWSKAILKNVAWSNGPGYYNPEFDRLIEASAVENDPTKRRELLVKFQQLAQDELPSVNLLELQHFSVLSRRVNGLSIDRDGYSKSFADVWLAAKDA